VPSALITGASTGIGRATALRLYASGWTVLAGVRSPEAGERLRADAGASERLVPTILDVTDEAHVAAAVQRVGELGDGGAGRLDALVNNAGIAVGGPLEVIADHEVREQFEVNVFGQIAITRALLPALRAARGRIVFLSSIGGRVATPYLSPYSASKYAIEAVADALRVELHTSGVQVALIEPGAVATPMWGKGRGDLDRLSIPAELQPEYGQIPKTFEKVITDTEHRGVPPDLVAATIERALGARRMRARYVVGRDARVTIALSALLPATVFDRVLRRALGV
jgi:NAD(P)-dependent dehydrogenase (short-subunit alcohol dehydrogenase family)